MWVTNVDGLVVFWAGLPDAPSRDIVPWIDTTTPERFKKLFGVECPERAEVKLTLEVIKDDR